MKKLLYSCIALSLLISSCKKEEDPAPTTDPYASLKQQIKENHCNIAFANYEDAYNKAVILQTKIQDFITSPSALTLQDARQAWLDAREPYGQTETLRFSDGPIDDGDGPEGYINSWPLDEAYIDYVSGNSTSGIINNTASYPTLSSSVLLSLNQSGSEENVAMGYHAIEFLLWGQDTSTSTAGTRPHTDYLTSGGTAANQARRGQYLQICADVLVLMLDDLKNQWAVGGTYRTDFLAMDNSTALRKMLIGMKTLSGDELSGERMYVAYNNQDQEDEHSCFSDNTHRDIYLNYKGMENVYKGEYLRTDGTTTVSGSSLEDLLAQVNPTLNAEILTLFDDSEAKIGLIYIPFDQAIVLPAERPKVLDAVYALQNLSEKIVDGASAIGIYLPE